MPREAERRSVVQKALTGIPNRISTARLLLIPALWVLALLRLPEALGIGVALVAFTDVVDGVLARRRGLTTDFGARLDSFADHLLGFSTAAWLVLLRPDFAREQAPLLLGFLSLGVTALAIGWLRFRRFGGLHLYSAKAASVLAYAFAVWLLLFGSYPYPLFLVVYAAAVLAATETFLAFATLRAVDENMGTLLSNRRRARQ
jgi:phosphatidylglycerophosphate synthase